MLKDILSIFQKKRPAGAKKDLVSIIIPTHQRFDLLSKGMDLLMRTKTDDSFGYEIILIDNGTNDEIRNKLMGLKDKYPDIHLIRNEQNLAFSYANDEGVKVSRGNYLCFYNDDIMAINPGWLKEMFACIRRHEKAGLVGAKLIYPDGTIQCAGIAFKKNLRPFCLHNGEPGNLRETRIERQFQAVSFGCVLVKKETYDKVDGFEKLGKKFEYYAEDFDFCFKARAAGYEVWYCPRAVMIHHCASTSKSMVHPETTDAYLKRFIEKWKDKIVTEYD